MAEETPPPVAIAIAIVQHAGRVLIGQRPAGVPLAGLWEFPGGKLLPAESAEQAAARECREETGLAVRIGDVYAEIVHQYPHGTVHLRFFAAEPLDANQPPRPPFVWVPLTELENYAFPPANRPVIQRLGSERTGPRVVGAH